MVEIRTNLSITGWFEVIFNGQVVEEVQGRNKALRIARVVAKENKTRHIAFEGKIIEIETD